MTSVICIDGSSGSLAGIQGTLKDLPLDFVIPVVAIVRRHVESCGVLIRMLRVNGDAVIIEPFDDQPLTSRALIRTPSEDHLLVHAIRVRLLMGDADYHGRCDIRALFGSAAMASGKSATGVLSEDNSGDGAAEAALARAKKWSVMSAFWSRELLGLREVGEAPSIWHMT